MDNKPIYLTNITNMLIRLLSVAEEVRFYEIVFNNSWFKG